MLWSTDVLDEDGCPSILWHIGVTTLWTMRVSSWFKVTQRSHDSWEGRCRFLSCRLRGDFRRKIAQSLNASISIYTQLIDVVYYSKLIMICQYFFALLFYVFASSFLGLSSHLHLSLELKFKWRAASLGHRWSRSPMAIVRWLLIARAHTSQK